MASLGELLQYAQAQQQPNTLAGVATHFLEGANQGYEAGRSRALKDQENPLVEDPITHKKQRLDVIGKLLDVEAKRASIEEMDSITKVIHEQTGAKDLSNRQSTLANMADNALKESAGAAGTDKSEAGQIANLVTGSGNAAKKKVKIKMGITGGKPTVNMEFEDPKTTTVSQIQAMKAYVDKADDMSTAALATAFPEGVPDWAAKFMAQHTELKMKKDAISQERATVRNQHRLVKLSEALDPSKQRQGAFGVSKQVFDRAERLESLAGAFPDGNLDSRQIEELAIGLNAMLSGSNTGAQEQVKSLVPKTIWGNAQKTTEWLTNEPRGVQQQAFVKRMLSSISREKETATSQIKRTQLSRLSPFASLEKDDPEGFISTLQSFGIEPEEYEAFKKGGHKPASAVVKGGEDTGGRIKVSNGKEILLIDPADAAAAAKDGYQTL